MYRSIVRRCQWMLPLLLLVSLPSFAQSSYRSSESTPQENVTYGYAQVMRVDPVYQTVSQRSNPQRCESRNGRGNGGDPTGGTVLGAVVGGLLGHQAGKGDGRKAATIAGAVAGGAIGRNIDKNNNSDPQGYDCSDSGSYETREIIGYDVEYQYKGERYVSRLPYDPGNRVRVRVSVMPDRQVSSYR